MQPAIRISDFGDHRTPEQLGQDRALEQERADLRLEAEWKRRVAENERRRRAKRVELIVQQLEQTIDIPESEIPY